MKRTLKIYPASEPYFKEALRIWDHEYKIQVGNGYKILSCDCTNADVKDLYATVACERIMQEEKPAYLVATCRMRSNPEIFRRYRRRFRKNAVVMLNLREQKKENRRLRLAGN